MAGRPSSRISPLGLAVLPAAVFTALRLAHGISWSWWWVLSPLWVLAAILVLIFAGIVMTAAIDQYAGRADRKSAAAPSAQRRQSSRPATADSRDPDPARRG
jgi:Transmembrane Fragile-X-F protein